MAILLEPLKDLLRCCEDPMSGGADLKAEAQKVLYAASFNLVLGFSFLQKMQLLNEWRLQIYFCEVL